MPIPQTKQQVAVAVNTFSYYEAGKRFLDIIGGLTGVVLFSPLMILTAIYIKIVSPGGPVFVEAKNRVGKGGKEFGMYKFRTMIPNAQEWLKTQPELYKQYQDNGYKLDPDPRWIRGAKIIRKLSLDEFPQFLNVLFGDMSLVGYRAYYGYEIKEQTEKHPETKELLEKALTLKPGITGVWQTSGRSNVSFQGRIKMDADYAEKKSLMYDVMIILKTPYVVITGKGAL
jgi:lipopolysaccharide/colanic/teichoic acid biosynthesis glycosyltransferase